MKIKVCGMRDSRNIKAVEELGIDWMGFVLYAPSPRFAACVPSYLPLHTRRVGVFVDAPREYILRSIALFGLNTLQLHGHESPEECCRWHNMGYEVIKAISVKASEDLKHALDYQEGCDYLLFDTKGNGYGGTGKRFNWNYLDDYYGRVPFLLSGGITVESLQAIAAISHPQMVGIDLNSGFETAPGLKDTDCLYKFIEQIKSISL